MEGVSDAERLVVFFEAVVAGFIDVPALSCRGLLACLACSL